MTNLPHTSWHRFDMAVVLVGQPGDKNCQVVAADVYLNSESEQWAARYLPLGEFDTHAAARAYVEQVEQPVLRQDGTGWEPLTPRVWEYYCAQAQLTLALSGQFWAAPLPSTVPPLADDAIVAAGQQNLAARLGSPELFWHLEVLPTKNRVRRLLGYSVVMVNHPESTGSLHYTWLGIGQFEAEEAARSFAATFQSTVPFEMGPGMAESLAGELNLRQVWTPMSDKVLDQMHLEEWTLICAAADWHPQNVAHVAERLVTLGAEL